MRGPTFELLVHDRLRDGAPLEVRTCRHEASASDVQVRLPDRVLPGPLSTPGIVDHPLRFVPTAEPHQAVCGRDLQFRDEVSLTEARERVLPLRGT
jgi:hypothetical protein